MEFGFTEKVRELERQEFSVENVHSMNFHTAVTWRNRELGLLISRWGHACASF